MPLPGRVETVRRLAQRGQCRLMGSTPPVTERGTWLVLAENELPAELADRGLDADG